VSGFPTRISRTSLGPELENERPVKDPTREIGAGAFNLEWWQSSGMNRTAPQAVFLCSVDSAGTTVTVDYQGLAFDPNDGVSPITFTYKQVGYYTFAFASQYPDETGSNISLSIEGGMVVPTGTNQYSGTHTGANNAATLTDSAQSWTVGELIGFRIYNVTDGSAVVVTANTANTVTGVLAGGTDNDWDTGDEYFLLSDDLIGVTGSVTMTSAYEGFVTFNNHNLLVKDPLKFALVLW
jgi:hypothetical protein